MFGWIERLDFFPAYLAGDPRIRGLISLIRFLGGEALFALGSLVEELHYIIVSEAADVIAPSRLRSSAAKS